jgi:DNA-binding transcriptional ArsR family regulator
MELVQERTDAIFLRGLDTSEISDIMGFSMTTPDIFAVLANPVRRRILELLMGRPYTVNHLVSEFPLHRPAVSEHLQVLRNAGLVRDERRGRERYYHLDPERLIEVDEWLKPFARYWRERMQALDAVLDKEER